MKERVHVKEKNTRFPTHMKAILLRLRFHYLLPSVTAVYKYKGKFIEKINELWYNISDFRIEK